MEQLAKVIPFYRGAIEDILWARRGSRGPWIALELALTRRVHEAWIEGLALTLEDDRGAVKARLERVNAVRLLNPKDGWHAALCAYLPSMIEPCGSDLLVLRDETSARLAFERWRTLAEAADAARRTA